MDVEVLRSKFVKTYAAVPTKLREEIIALVEDKPYNWDAAYIEIVGKTKAGEEILKHLISIGLLQEEG